MLSFAEIKEKYEDFIILVSFGSHLADVREAVLKHQAEHELYIPDVPLYGGDIFDSVYFENNKDKLMEVREMLSDGKSKEYFDAVINFRLSGKYKYLLLSEEPRRSLELLDTKNIEVTCDLGAYKGDTAKLFFDTFENSKKNICS